MTKIFPNLGRGLDNGCKFFELFFRKSIKGLSIESLLWGNGDGALKVFGNRG